MSCDSITCNQERNCTCAHPSVCPDHATAWAGCTCGPATPAKTKAPRTPGQAGGRLCAELGVCQARTPPCTGCSHNTSDLPPGGFWFAPGVIDFEPQPEPWSWLEIALAGVVASGAAGFVAGLAYAAWKGLL